MSTLEFNIDFGPILMAHAEQAKALSAELEMGVQALAASTHAHVLEGAAKKLHSRQEMYTKACDLTQIAKNVWAITVHKEALWIEDGMPAHSMVPDMLASPKAKTAADGSKYMVIPFSHAKAPTRQTTEAQGITQKLRAELKAKQIPYQKIERNPNGSPKLGLLHSLNLGGEQRGATQHNMAWSSPVLNGVRIYQNLVKNKKGGESVKRDIMTFRVVSSKHFGLKWNYPGIAGVRLLDEALTWAADHWVKEILPTILAKYA